MKTITVFSMLFLLSTTSMAIEAVKTNIINIAVTEKGFEPGSINVYPGELATLKVIRKTNSTCATQIQIPSLKIKKDLPLNQIVTIDIGKLPKGEIRFGCGMNMMEGGIIYAK